MFRAEPVTESFFEDAPFRMQDNFAIRQPASSVWAELTSESPLSWCRLLGSVTWTSPPPHGVGAMRIVRTRPAFSVLQERFFIWEEGRRNSFYVLESRAPGFRAFAEDYLVEPTSESSCRFTWTIAAEPKGLARFGQGANKALLRTLFTDTRRYFAAT
jgi:hypothetical protein